MEKPIEWIIPVSTISEANSSEHWSKKAKRHRLQKQWVWLYFRKLSEPIKLPCTVTLTRMSPRTLDDDNLVSSLKWIRDAVSEELSGCHGRPGMADNNPLITWKYSQEKSKKKNVKINFQ